MELYIISAIILVILIVCFAKFVILSPELKYHSFWYKIKAKLMFWFGKVRRLHHFPWLTWAVIEHLVNLRESREACLVSRPGDVGLHKDEGFGINLAIPGSFKHAWIVVDENMCVEANQYGVLHRDHLFPLVTDYAMILRPRDVSLEDVQTAVKRAMSIIGCDYDANFNFNLDEEDKEYAKKYTKNLSGGYFHPAFSCTETVAFAWYHRKDWLRIFRSVHAGREAVIADDFLRMNYDIIWMSKSVTNKWAKETGMHEEGRNKIQEYLR